MTTRVQKRIACLIQKQQFNPGLTGIFVNPFYHARRELFRVISNLAKELRGKTLDIGCGSKPYEILFSQSTEYIGMDVDSPENRAQTKADYFYDGNRFPFPDGSFDSAVSTEVLEHIFNPDQFFSETNRVLRQGGKCLLTCPFVWDEHSQPFDYARYSSFGVAYLLDKHGFKIVRQMKTATDIRVLFQLASCYMHKIIPFKNYRLRVCCYATLIAPINLAGLVLYRLLPKNKDLYLHNVILAEKISHG